MENKVYSIGKGKKIIATSDYIAISSKKFKDYEDMKSKAEMISQKDNFQIIKKKDLHQLKYDEIGIGMKLQFSSYQNMNDSVTLTPSNKEELGELGELGELIGQQFEMLRDEKEDKKVKYLFRQVIKIIFSIASSVFLVYLSSMNNGETIEVSGRRKSIKLLIFKALDVLGPIGTSIVCTIVVGLMIYFAYKKFRTPSSQIIFSRKK